MPTHTQYSTFMSGNGKASKADGPMAPKFKHNGPFLKSMGHWSKLNGPDILSPKSQNRLKMHLFKMGHNKTKF